MAKAGEYRGPLEGLDVVDFGHYFAGPMAAMLLAEQGANVVRIVRPGPPEVSPQQFRLLNRNKKVVSLDLQTETGRDAARSLLERADVAIESFRPGVMRRLGLDRASIAGANPGLVYLSLPGFASTDGERSQLQGWEGVVSAAASLYTTGLRQKLGFPPLYVPAPVCSAFASLHGAIAILAALAARDRSGRGTSIEVPLVNAGISTCTRSFVYDAGRLRAETSDASDATLPPFLEPMAITPDDTADQQRAKLQAFAELAPPIFSTHQYRSADGRRLLIMPIKPEMAARFFEILGLDTQLKREGFVIESPWEKVDLGLANNLASSWTLSRERSERVIELVQEVIATRTAAEWETLLAEAGIPIGCLRTRDEWLSIEALYASGLLTRMDDGSSELRVPGRVADVSGPGAALLDTRYREPEQVEPQQLGSLFPEPPRAPEPAAAGPARKSDLLAGLKVLDLCNVVAGPNAAYTLAQFGADVIRVEPPKSFNLPMHLEWTLEVNQGKRSMVLDTRTEPGREILARLVGWADLVVHNRLDDVAERLGVTLEQLQQIDPEVVVCQNSAFGGPRRGAWDRIPGYDPMPNMTTGLDVLAGSPESPRGMTEIFADLMGGLGTAWSGVLALHQLRRTGYAGEGRSSLARAANFYQLPYMIGEAGQSDWGQGSGPDARGDCWWQRMYACRDGWLYVGASAERAELLAEAVAGRRDADEAALERAFEEQDAAHWQARLESIDVGCHPVLSLEELCDPARIRDVDNSSTDEVASGALEILRWPNHPSGLPIVLPAPAWVQLGEMHSYRRLSPTPKVGEHTREILAELGYSPTEIERLFQLRVAHDYLPAIGTPDAYFYHQQKADKP